MHHSIFLLPASLLGILLLPACGEQQVSASTIPEQAPAKPASWIIEIPAGD